MEDNKLKSKKAPWKKRRSRNRARQLPVSSGGDSHHCATSSVVNNNISYTTNTTDENVNVNEEAHLSTCSYSNIDNSQKSWQENNKDSITAGKDSTATVNNIDIDEDNNKNRKFQREFPPVVPSTCISIPGAFNSLINEPIEHSQSIEHSQCPTTRRLHLCAVPWRPGIRTAPVQLQDGPTQVYHRSILAILNRITDTKMEQLVHQATCVMITGDVTNTSQGTDDTAFLVPMVAAVGKDVTKVRKDFISMLLEKAQDEELYSREYSVFLLWLCRGVERQERATPESEATEGSSLSVDQSIPAPRGDKRISEARRRQLNALTLPLLINEEFMRRFHHLLHILRGLYDGSSTWQDEIDIHTRRQMVTHLQLGVQLHLCCQLLPVSTLFTIRDQLAQPLELHRLNQHLINHNPGTVSSLPCLCTELLARYLMLLGHLNLQDLGRCEQVCTVLGSNLGELSSRHVYLVMAALQMQTDRWRQPTPHRRTA